MTKKISKKKLILSLEKTSYKTEAAKLLKIPEISLYYWINKYDLRDKYISNENSVSKERLVLSLEKTRFKTEAAKLLKIPVISLYFWINVYGLRDKYISKGNSSNLKQQAKTIALEEKKLLRNQAKIDKKLITENNKKFKQQAKIDFKKENESIDSLLDKIGEILIRTYTPKRLWRKNKTSIFRKLGIKNNATLLNEYTGYSCTFIYKTNEQTIKIPYVYLYKNGWPANIENFLNKQIIQKSDFNGHLERLRLRLLKEGATLLDTEWKGWKHKYNFKDYKGNIGSMCCSNFFPITRSINHLKNNDYYLNKLRKIAKHNNGELLSTEWKGCNQKYIFKDKFGEVFSKWYSGILRGQWTAKKDEQGNKIVHTWRKQASREVERYNQINSN